MGGVLGHLGLCNAGGEQRTTWHLLRTNDDLPKILIVGFRVYSLLCSTWCSTVKHDIFKNVDLFHKCTGKKACGIAANLQAISKK
jgi:hypothetical protein